MARLVRWLLLLVPAVAHAQFLDFDGACPAPPCAAGLLYAAVGVTLAPGATPVVAAGTNGLTGPSGGAYLSVTTFPADVTLGLARSPAYVALQLARASTATGTVTVQITALKAGVPVDANVVTLDAVNAWRAASVRNDAGIDEVFVDASGGGVLAYGIDAIHVAGACNGFVDVLSTDIFCNAAEWLANRSVTTGCTATAYCPTAAVTRAQMALFMQRLAQAVTPRLLDAQCTPSGTFQSPGQDVCTVTVAPGKRRREASLRSYCRFVNFAAGKSIDHGLHYYVDQGASSFAANAVTMAASAGVGEETSSANGSFVSVLPGREYRFVIRLSHGTGAAAEAVNASCRLLVELFDGDGGGFAPHDAPG